MQEEYLKPHALYIYVTNFHIVAVCCRHLSPTLSLDLSSHTMRVQWDSLRTLSFSYLSGVSIFLMLLPKTVTFSTHLPNSIQ